MVGFGELAGMLVLGKAAGKLAEKAAGKKYELTYGTEEYKAEVSLEGFKTTKEGWLVEKTTKRLKEMPVTDKQFLVMKNQMDIVSNGESLTSKMYRGVDIGAVPKEITVIKNKLLPVEAKEVFVAKDEILAARGSMKELEVETFYPKTSGGMAINSQLLEELKLPKMKDTTITLQSK